MRGEKTRRESHAKVDKGSPPRARGKAGSRPYASAFIRITPACAGKRPVSFGFLAQLWDHPRVRGEKTKKCVYSAFFSDVPSKNI